jgi:hypothetical protein
MLASSTGVHRVADILLVQLLLFCWALLVISAALAAAAALLPLTFPGATVYLLRLTSHVGSRL